MGAKWKKDKIVLQAENDFARVKQEINRREGFDFDHNIIVKATSVYHQEEDKVLCGIFLIVEYQGLKSFHGYKFVEGGLDIQLELAREFIEGEGTLYSSYRNKYQEYVLRKLGFSDPMKFGEILIMRRT